MALRGGRNGLFAIWALWVYVKRQRGDEARCSAYGFFDDYYNVAYDYFTTMIMIHQTCKHTHLRPICQGFFLDRDLDYLFFFFGGFRC